MPDFPESAVAQRMREFQKGLVAWDADTIYQMGNQWLRLEYALEANIQLLAMELAELGEEINLASVYRHRRYQKLLSQMRYEMKLYNHWAADFVAGNQKKLGVLGIDNGAELIQLALLEGGMGVGTFFDRLPVSAIELMVGTAGDGGPIYTLLQEAYPTAVEQMTNVLIQNVALGIGPGETAKAMMNGVAGGLNHALTVARTEQLRVYREASRQQYEKSGAVQRYMRFASKSGNTCALCLALDGEIVLSKEALHVHPNCRCVPIPIVNGVDPPKWETGSEWLKKQDTGLQQKILGKGAYEMWAKGDIELMDLVNKVEHPIWGPSLKRNTLESLQ